MNIATPADRTDVPVHGRSAALFVSALYVLHTALFAFATLIPDSGRDLANGLAIASGASVPLQGPGLFGVWHLGPAWYLLLALPLALGGGVGITAVFVGALAATKIPLAYILGNRLRDRTLGLLCAACIALPGWQTFGALVLSHTALVEALVLATLLCCVVAAQERRPLLAVLAALLLALALHAHPTALLFAPAVAWSLWRSPPRRRVAWTLLAAGAFALPFLPVLWAEAQAGWPQLAGTGRYLGDSAFAARIARLPAVLWGIGWNGSVFVREMLLGRIVLLGWFWQILVALLWIGAAAGCIRALRQRDGRPAGLLLAWIGAVAFVTLLRDITPVWMVYVCAPLLVLFWAAGLHALLADSRIRRHVASAAGSVAVLLAVALLADRVTVARDGVQAVPASSVVDVAQPVQREAASRFWLTGFGHDAIARFACDRAEDTVALHGDLAAAFDFGQGVAAALHCTPDRLPHIGGADAAYHVAGVPRALAPLLGLDPSRAQHGFVLHDRLRVLHPAHGRVALPDTHYRADEVTAAAAGGERTLALTIPCMPGEWLVVTNAWPGLNPLRTEVHSDAGPVLPDVTSLSSAFHRCDGATRTVTLRTLLPEVVDVFVLQ